MSTTLLVESFSPVNIGERTSLAVGADANAEGLTVLSTEGFTEDTVIYVGLLSREGCERAVIESVDSPTTITLVDPLELPHSLAEPVTAVLGSTIRIYRAANVDGTAPADGSFTLLNSRLIDPDQLSSYYTDSDGNSDYWYKATYYNPVSGEETDLGEAVAVRGDDFGHYASLTEIRAEAGFSNNYNLKDTFVDQQRRGAEAEINAALSNVYTTPFDPVPEMIRVLTIQLAAGLLMQAEYGSSSSKGKDKLNAAREQIKALQNQDSSVTDGDGSSLAAGRVSFYPDEDAPRAFFMGDKF